MKARTIIQAVLAGSLCFSASALAQINKDLVEAANPEPPELMPHIDPDNPDVIRLKKAPNRDMWRTEVDYGLFPDREAGPMNLQRYEAQLETIEPLAEGEGPVVEIDTADPDAAAGAAARIGALVGP